MELKKYIKIKSSVLLYLIIVTVIISQINIKGANAVSLYYLKIFFFEFVLYFKQCCNEARNNPCKCSGKGSKGDSGYAGQTGNPGIRGSQGDKGLPGNKGPRGDTGLAGGSGMKGPKVMSIKILKIFSEII